MLAMVLPSWSATVYPASTNGANVFTGTNTFTTRIIATNSTGGFIGNGGGLTNLMLTNIVNVAALSDTNVLVFSGGDLSEITGPKVFYFRASPPSYTNSTGTEAIYPDAPNPSSWAMTNNTVPLIFSKGDASPAGTWFNEVTFDNDTSAAYGTNQVVTPVFTTSGSTITSTNPFVMPNLSGFTTSYTNLVNLPQIVTNYDYGRYTWTNAATALVNSNLSVLFLGSGLMLGIYSPISTNLQARIAVRGYSTPYGGAFFMLGSSGAITVNGSGLPVTNIFWSFYTYLTNTPNTVTWADGTGVGTGLPLANMNYVVYVSSPAGGTFKVQQCTNGASFDDVPTYNNVNGVDAWQAKTLRWTNNGLFKTAIRVVGLTAGTNYFINAGTYNTSSNGVVLGLSSSGPSSGLGSYFRVDDSIRKEVWQSTSNNLCIVESVEGVTAQIVSDISRFLSSFKTNCPTSDLVACASPPTFNSDHAAHSIIIRTNIPAYSYSFFDTYSRLAPIGNWYARGATQVGDALPHPTDALGYPIIGKKIFRFLDLFGQDDE